MSIESSSFKLSYGMSEVFSAMEKARNRFQVFKKLKHSERSEGGGMAYPPMVKSCSWKNKVQVRLLNSQNWIRRKRRLLPRVFKMKAPQARRAAQQ